MCSPPYGGAVTSSGCQPTMRASHRRTILAITVALGACVPWTPSDPTWSGALKVPGAPRGALGTASLYRAGTANETHVTVELQRLAEGEVARWRLHEGSCRKPGELLGPVAQMPDLQGSANRPAQVSVTVDLPMPEVGSYSIVVTAPDGRPLACAELKRREPVRTNTRRTGPQRPGDAPARSGSSDAPPGRAAPA